MTDQSDAKTSDSPGIDHNDRESEVPASLEPPVGAVGQSPTPDAPRPPTPDLPPPKDNEPVPVPDPPATGADLEPSPPQQGSDLSAGEGGEEIQPADNEQDEVANGWEDLLGDGKVFKRIVRAGSGSIPELHSVCLGACEACLAVHTSLTWSGSHCAWW